MKVILLEDVRKVGKKDEIVECSDGYATNYLIKKNLAVPLTKRSREVLDVKLDKEAALEASRIAEYNKLKDKYQDTSIEFIVKTGAQDKVFGKISTKQIADKLKTIGLDVDKKNIKLDADLDVLGTHEVLIELHKQVKFKIKVILKK